MSYFFSTSLNKGFDDTVDRVVAELKSEGFGILTEIDVKGTLKAKLDVDFRNIASWAPATRPLPTGRCRRKTRSAPCCRAT